MKIVDVPQTGKLGLTVTYPGRNGLIRRTKVTPSNPRTGAQTLIRANLASAASSYDGLTDAQQEAWIAAAATQKSKPTLGQSGPLTGLQLYVKVNASLLAIGSPAVSVPPARPPQTPLPIDALEITNTGGTIAIKLHTTDAPPDHTMLWGCAPQGSGVRRPISPRLLGVLDSPTGSYVDVTEVYTDKFGAPAVGQRVFIQVNANTVGYQGQRLVFSARVPASA